MKGRKIRRFEGWISARLQAPYLSGPLSPCQCKTWQYILPHCERGQIAAAKHPIQNYDLFAQNVNGSQLDCDRSDALWELLIVELRHLFIEIVYIKYCAQLITILYQCRKIRHTSSYDLKSSACVVIEDETAGRRYVTCGRIIKCIQNFRCETEREKTKRRTRELMVRQYMSYGTVWLCESFLFFCVGPCGVCCCCTESNELVGQLTIVFWRMNSLCVIIWLFGRKPRRSDFVWLGRNNSRSKVYNL